MKPAIAVVGSLNMDFTVTADRLPHAGETVPGRGFEMTPGGKGANQAFAAAKLAAGSVLVRMVGRVGHDWMGDRLKTSLAGAGADVSAVHASRSSATGTALIAVDAQGQNQIVVAPGANAELLAGDAEAMRRVLRAARVALFQLETPLETVTAAMQIAREEGVVTILDPAPAQPLRSTVMELADILTPNETEACMLLDRNTGRIAEESAPEVAARLVALGARAVVLKMGDRGCFYLGTAGSFRLPAFEAQAVDATGAGDTFNAALAVALTENQTIPDALRFASAAAALSVTRRGAQASAPARSEVNRLISDAAR